MKDMRLKRVARGFWLDSLKHFGASLWFFVTFRPVKFDEGIDMANFYLQQERDCIAMDKAKEPK